MKQLNILIATTKHPAEGKEQGITDAFIQMAEDYDCTVTAIKGMPGPGCYNFAVKAEGERAEEFAKELCMALQPGRWTTTKDEFTGFNYSY